MNLSKVMRSLNYQPPAHSGIQPFDMNSSDSFFDRLTDRIFDASAILESPSRISFMAISMEHIARTISQYIAEELRNTQDPLHTRKTLNQHMYNVFAAGTGECGEMRFTAYAAGDEFQLETARQIRRFFDAKGHPEDPQFTSEESRMQLATACSMLLKIAYADCNKERPAKIRNPVSHLQAR